MTDGVAHGWTRKAVTRGREQVVGLVRDELDRGGVPRGPLPVVVLAGPLGGGGTTVLDKLWTEFFEKSLSVRLDVADAQSVEDIVLAAVQGWRRRISGIPRIDFPRTSMIFKALSFDDDGSGREGFEAYLQARPQDAAVRTALRDWAHRAAPMLPPDQQVFTETLAELLGALQSAVSRRRNKDVLRWLADYGPPDGSSGYDRLWEQRRLHQQHTDGSARAVGKMLCAALLADTRAAFQRHDRLRNALLLLDNADSVKGDLFLDLLTECRRESHSEQAEPDAVLVVAVRHSPVHAARMGVPVASDDARQLSLHRGENTAPRWWIPIRLTDLTKSDDVVPMCSSSVLGSDYRDADFLHDLTGGHPEAVDRLADLLRDAPAAYGPRTLLTEPLPPRHNWPSRWPPDDGTDTTVEDYLLKRTLPQDLAVLPDGRIDPEANPDLDAMAVLAATPGLRRGACTAVFHFLGWTANANAAQLRLTSGLWLDETADGAAGRLHPLIALLLRRWLARKPEVWRDTHTAYAAHYSRPQDASLRHHHTLALVEPSHREPMTTVIGHLERELDRAAATEDWLTVLGAVTEAPNRVRTTGDPRSFVTTLAGVAESGDRRQSVTRLAISRWLFHDRYFDPARRLAQSIANEYERLAEYVPDNEVLFTEAGKYRRIENEWKG
ncbi:ATP-binding protein [Streptomyces sp. NPDC001817]|uniref:ATP-binding protein n=1 Tax=Streptomyces sp. NPDC001817 TaxID=3154398 RepID=UPI003330F7BA